jgi:hypothetical protein
LQNSCGFAFSGDYPEASISDLLHEADLKMYEDKIRTKEEQKAKEKQEKK